MPAAVRGVSVSPATDLAALPDAAFDDVVALGARPETVETLFGKVAPRGLFLIACAGRRFARPVAVPVGRTHYGGIRLVGTTSADPADALRAVPGSGELRPGEVVEIAAEETTEFLGRAPLAALPGVSAEFALQLAALGLQRGRDLAALPPDAVARALGEQGRRLQKIVRGEAGEEEPTMIGERAGEEEPGVAAQAELRPPTGEKERILAAFRRAAEEVARILREQGQVGSRIRIDLVFRDLRTVGARRTLRQATRSEEVIFHTAQDLFARARLGDRLVRRVRIRIGRLVVGPQGGQLALPLLPQEARRERLSEMVSRVRDRFGERAVTRGAVLALRER